MSSAQERHVRHEKTFEGHEERISELETAVTKEITWRTGDETPHRGAEGRIHKMEEEAVLHSEMKQIASEVVTAYLKSFRGVLQTIAPYILLIAAIVYGAITGHAP